VTVPADDDVARWAASGAMALTGRADAPPLGPPARLVGSLDQVASGIVTDDPLALLGERAALLGLARRSPATCGGTGRLLRCLDGWIAVSLARPSDVELLAAWLELPDPVDPAEPGEDLWAFVEGAVSSRPGSTLRERAALLGLPAAVVGADGGRDPVVRIRGAADRRARPVDGSLVVDLSSLWAGPLCGQLLTAHGATVVKVESTGRPDGARQGEPRFFDLLNGQKRSVALDLATPAGRSALAGLLDCADVVIEASRPRALDQLGLGAHHHVAGGWSGVWVSITGYGRTGEDGTRVAFGDDAAAAGGLVAWAGDQPSFCADAIADPLTGITAAAAAIDALGTDGTWLLDVSMAAVAAAATGPTRAVPVGLDAASPRARPVRGTAPSLGTDTDAVLRELGIGS
jgi:hypothetical protein